MRKNIITLSLLSSLLTYSSNSFSLEQVYYHPVIYTVKIFKQEDPNCDSIPAIGVYDKTSILANPTKAKPVLTLTKKSKDWFDYPKTIENYSEVYLDSSSNNKGTISGNVPNVFTLTLFKDSVYLEVYLKSFHINIDNRFGSPSLFFSGKANVHKKHIVKEGQIVRFETTTCYVEHGKNYKDIFILDAQEQHTQKKLTDSARTGGVF